MNNKRAYYIMIRCIILYIRRSYKYEIINTRITYSIMYKMSNQNKRERETFNKEIPFESITKPPLAHNTQTHFPGEI